MDSNLKLNQDISEEHILGQSTLNEHNEETNNQELSQDETCPPAPTTSAIGARC
jgi:hypothetical protein